MRKLQGSPLIHSIRATPAPLWLLEKDDTRFLYLSFLLSSLVHLILFAVLAATRIFHPFAGASTEFALVWFAPPPVSGTREPVNDVEPAPARKSFSKTPEARKVLPRKEMTSPPSPEQVSLPEKPVAKPPDTPAKVQPATNVAKEPGPEMVISRYGGKVVDVVEKKTDIPVFKTFSSVKIKSDHARAKVVTVSKSVAPSPPSAPAEKVSKKDIPRKTDANGANEKPANVVVTASAKPSTATESRPSVVKKSLQGRHSSSVAPSLPGKGVEAAVHRVTNEVTHLSAAPASPAPETRKAAIPVGGNGETVSEGKSSLANRSAGIQEKKPLAPERKAEAASEKPSPPTAEKPQAIFHPPLAGDLKLVITGDREVKVEAFFKEYRKARRGKPLSRWEARNRRDIIPKTVRTRENVNEAVIEIAEEGIYDLTVKSADGKPVEATFVLKVHESRPGAKSRNLGKRSVAEKATIARVLMPEGILWDDDASFTGNMEDSESITKFQAETGLVWREYK